MDVCCAAGAPVTVDYTPTGSHQELNDVPCYLSKPQGTAIKAVVAIYDIFGVTPQVNKGDGEDVL